MGSPDLLKDSQNCRTNIWKMFDRIAPRYDILNRILSLGLDMSWRYKTGKYLNSNKGLKILDLATGTGEMLIAMLSSNQNISYAVGLDMSPKMLAIAEKKITGLNLAHRARLIQADVAKIPFAENSFDIVTTAFGIRNVPDVAAALAEMHRVLKPGGRAIILEFSLPENIVLRKLFLLYLRIFVPAVGAIISGDYWAYRYLNKSVETFLSREELCQIMRSAGFTNVNVAPMTFGVACIYYGDKPASDL